MTTTQDLREQRASVWAQMEAIMAAPAGENGTLSAEQTAAYDKAETDLSGLTDRIEREDRHTNHAKDMNRVDREGVVDPSTGEPVKLTDADRAYSEAFHAFMRGGVTAMTTDQQRVLRSGFEQPQNAQGAGTGSAGGYLVPQGFRQKIVETMKYYSGVRGNTEHITTDTGNTLPWPTNDDTGNVGARLTENSQISQQDLSFGQAQLSAWTYTSKLILVSWQLQQDSIFDVETFLARKIGQRIGRIQNTELTTGTGSGASMPNGIQNAAATGVTLGTGNTTAITGDGLIDLIHSVDPAYRQQAGGTAKFMLSDTALKTIRKLKDSQNRYLWEPSVQAGVPDTLLGYGIIVNNDIPVPAASVKSVLFGDFVTGYVVRDASDVRTIRMDERYADYLQTGWFGFVRTDGVPQDTAAYKALVQSAT